MKNSPEALFAFGSVFLLGVVGFIVSWNSAPNASGAAAKGKSRSKKQPVRA